ncbi:hypothetical protein JSY14_07430 [Brachybacterium sp. EF45031]|nr:hypothetical protein [Brachybacterium sillae]
MDLVSLGPVALAPGDSLAVTLRVTNTSEEPLVDPRLELRARTARVTSRADLERWQSDPTPEEPGTARATADPTGVLAPGESLDLTLSVPADDLGWSSDPDLWGTRRVALTVADASGALATVRTFVVWRPDGTTARVDQSVLLPLTAQDPGTAALDPAAHAQDLREGRLGAMLALARRDDVDWLLDPALLDPPFRPTAPGAPSGDPSDAAPAEGPPPAASDAGGAVPPGPDASSGPPQDTPANPPPVGTGVDPITAEPQAAATVQALTDAAGNRTVLALPYGRADVQALRSAGAEGLRTVAEDRSREAFARTGITPAATVAVVPGERADPTQVGSALDSGLSALMIPSASLREDLESTVTPSGPASIAAGPDRGSVPVLAPDSTLSAEFALLDGSADPEQIRQRILAETAVIAAEPTSAPRHVLIAPPLTVTLSEPAASATLDALGQAPWLRRTPAQQLLEQTPDQTGTDGGGEGAGVLGTVPLEDVRPTGFEADGRATVLPSADAPEPAAGHDLRDLQSALAPLAGLSDAVQDPHLLDVPVVTALSGASEQWRGGSPEPRRRAELAAQDAARLTAGVSVRTPSSVNLVADASNVPVTVRNDLDSPVRLQARVSADKPLVRLGQPPVVEVPARSSTQVSVPVEAIANGQVTLSVELRSPDGTRLTQAEHASLTVNPAWENWTTLLVGIAMGLLVIVGVLRARRTGSDRRAPAERGPEPPPTADS